jgi:hypothetical protein
VENILRRYDTNGPNGSNGIAQEPCGFSDNHRENCNGCHAECNGSCNGGCQDKVDHQDHQRNSNGSPETVVLEQKNHSTIRTIGSTEDNGFPAEDDLPDVEVLA